MNLISTFATVARLGMLASLLLPGTACASQVIAPAQVQSEPSWIRVTAPTPIVINEILAHTDPPQVDAIELFNPTDQPASIGGWFLSENKDIPGRFQIPPNTLIPALGYYVFTEAQLGFRFSEFGETVYLYAPDANANPGALADKVQFGVSPNGISMGRYLTSTDERRFPLQSAITLGTANVGPLVGPLVISAIMYHPASGSEYVIITNAGKSQATLYDPAHPENTWKLSGLGDNNTDFALPPALVLGARASLVIASDPDAFRAGHPDAVGVAVVGPFPGKLNNEGERLALMKPQPPEIDPALAGYVAYAEMDVVEYSALPPWPPEADGQGMALERIGLDQYGDDPANWHAGSPILQATEVALLPWIRQ